MASLAIKHGANWVDPDATDSEADDEDVASCTELEDVASCTSASSGVMHAQWWSVHAAVGGLCCLE